MRILFLDVDGVMIPMRNYFTKKYRYRFDPVAVEAVKAICERTGAEVVMSTAWNAKLLPLFHILHGTGIPLYGGNEPGNWQWYTPYPEAGCSKIQGVERWIEAHPDVLDWCILDDDPDLYSNVRVVPVTAEFGITVSVYRVPPHARG